MKMKMKLKPDQYLTVKPLARKKKPKNAKVQFETVIEKVKCGKCCYDCNYWAKAYMVSVKISFKMNE